MENENSVPNGNTNENINNINNIDQNEIPVMMTEEIPDMDLGIVPLQVDGRGRVIENGRDGIVVELNYKELDREETINLQAVDNEMEREDA